MPRPSHVTLTEVGPRDGFQVEPQVIPTDVKLSIIHDLVDAGITSIQVASFVHPKWVPQMADAEEICARLDKKDGVDYIGLALNERGVERAHRAGLEIIEVSIATTDTNSRKNANMSLAEAHVQLKKMVERAHEYGLRVRAGLQTVFGCAYEGPVPEDRIVRMVETIKALDVSAISIADSTGRAHPDQVDHLLGKLLPITGDTPLILHVHDTRGLGLANVVAALEHGIAHFDTSLAGMGGCPFIPGATGNIATEDTAYLLESLGISTGLDRRKIATASRKIADVLQKTFPGKLYQLND